MTRTFIVRTGLAALLGLATATAAVAQSEDTSVAAFSVVRGAGVGFGSGDKAETVVGTFEGPFFVDAGEGPLKAGALVCSASVEINTNDRSQKASGRCLVTAPDGAEAYGHYACEGYFLVGCRGAFTLSGGSGRFVGIAGGGPMTMRATLAKIGDGSPGGRSVEIEGILFWRELKFKLP
jgi:hypothetical protein